MKASFPKILMLVLGVAADYRMERWEEAALEHELNRWPPRAICLEADDHVVKWLDFASQHYTDALNDPLGLHDDVLQMKRALDIYRNLDSARNFGLTRHDRWDYILNLRELLGEDAFRRAELPLPAPWWRWP